MKKRTSSEEEARALRREIERFEGEGGLVPDVALAKEKAKKEKKERLTRKRKKQKK